MDQWCCVALACQVWSWADTASMLKPAYVRFLFCCCKVEVAFQSISKYCCKVKVPFHKRQSSYDELQFLCHKVRFVSLTGKSVGQQHNVIYEAKTIILY